MNLHALFDLIQQFLAQHAILSPVLYVLAHIVFAACFIPCSPMAVIAGALWGKWLGLGISILSAFLSASTTFWLGRVFFRQRMYAFLSKRYPKTDWFLEQTKKQGWKFVASVKLNPAAPASTLGYLFGLTTIDFKIYAFFLFIFMLPLQVLLVFCGDACPELLTGKVSWLFIAMLLGILAYLFYGMKNESKVE